MLFPRTRGEFLGGSSDRSRRPILDHRGPHPTPGEYDVAPGMESRRAYERAHASYAPHKRRSPEPTRSPERRRFGEKSAREQDMSPSYVYLFLGVLLLIAGALLVILISR